MTTTVKVSCNGPKYRAVVVDRSGEHFVTQKDGEKSFNVGEDKQLIVTEEYSDDGTFEKKE